MLEGYKIKSALPYKIFFYFTYACIAIVSAELLCDWLEFLFYALFLQQTGVQKYTRVQ